MYGLITPRDLARSPQGAQTVNATSRDIRILAESLTVIPLNATQVRVWDACIDSRKVVLASTG